MLYTQAQQKLLGLGVQALGNISTKGTLCNGII